MTNIRFGTSAVLLLLLLSCKADDATPARLLELSKKSLDSKDYERSRDLAKKALAQIKWVQLLSNNVAEVLPTARNVMGFGVHRRLANTGCRFSSPRKDAVERSMRNVYELRLHTYPIFAHFGRISGRNSLK